MTMIIKGCHHLTESGREREKGANVGAITGTHGIPIMDHHFSLSLFNCS